MIHNPKKKLFIKFKTEKENQSIPESELHRTRNSKGEKFYNEYKYIQYLGEEKKTSNKKEEIKRAPPLKKDNDKQSEIKQAKTFQVKENKNQDKRRI